MQELTQEWNYHGLTTEGNYTPRQLWITGILSNRTSNCTAVEDILEGNQPDMSDYGIDEEGDIPELQTDNHVVVPESAIETTDEIDANLQQIMDTTTDDQYLIQKFLAVLDCIEVYQNSHG